MHAHVTLISPLDSNYMIQSGTYEHHCTLTVRKGTDGFGTALNLTFQAFNRVIGTNSSPVLVWKFHICERFFHTVFQLFSSRSEYENELDQKEPETDFQKWLVELFNKLHSLTGNNHIPKSHFTEYGFQKIGKNFSYPVNEKFTTYESNDEASDEEINENADISE